MQFILATVYCTKTEVLDLIPHRAAEINSEEKKDENYGKTDNRTEHSFNGLFKDE